MLDDYLTLRSELAAATRILADHRLVGMFGHVSVLTDDPSTYLVCPGAGARKDRCRASDVVCERHLFPPFGASPMEAHQIWVHAPQVWAPVVLPFLDRYLSGRA